MKIRSTIMSAVAAGLVAMTVVGAAAAETTTIRASNWHPPKHPVVTGGYLPFMEYVKRESRGSLDFKYWGGGALLGSKDSLPGLINGITDVTILGLTYFPARFPYAQLISDFAMLSDNPAAIAAAVTELVVLDCVPCREEFTKQGLVFTSSYSTTAYTLISRAPLTTPADLQGKKYRSGGAVWDRWIQFVGGTAINVSSAEIFESLNRGGIDVAIFSPSGLQSFSLWDIAKYDVMLPLGTYNAVALFTMNRPFWKRISNEQRRVLLNAAAVGSVGTTFGYEDSDANALKLAVGHGVKIMAPSEALIKQRAQFVEQDLLKLQANAKEKYKIADAAKWIAQYRTLLKKWESIVANAKGDRNKIIKAMQDEIYAKVDLSKYGM